MEICIRFGGELHCFIIPIVQVPIQIPLPGPGPVNYPAFLADAMLVASMRSMIQQVADGNVREALESGISRAVDAMQKHAGSEVTIRQAAS